MKKLSFLGIIFFSIFLFSCGGITETNEGTISFDAGQLARSLGSKLEPLSGNNRNADVQEIEYTMTISLSTSGDYVTSAKKDYKKNLSSTLTKDEFGNAIEDFYKEVTGTPITLDNIPVGSRIKVKVSLTLGTADNQKTTEGESDDFLVQSGENRVTIKVKRPALDSGNDNDSSSGGEEGGESGTGSDDGQEESGGEGEGGESSEGSDAVQGDAGGGNEGGQGQEGQGEGQEGQQQAEETTIDIILYNRIDPGEDPNVTEANYALYRFSEDVYSSDTVQTPKNAYSQGSKFTDFVVGADNKVYYTNGSDLYCDNEKIGDIVLNSYYDPAYPSNISISDTAKALFYMDGQTEYSLSFGAYDLEYGVNSNVAEYNHYDNTGHTCYVIRYTTSLVYGGETQSEESEITTYKGFLYLYLEDFQQFDTVKHINDKTFMKVPFTYQKINHTNDNTKEVSIVFDEPDLSNPEAAEYTDYFSMGYNDVDHEHIYYDLNDMTVQDGYLYALFSQQTMKTAYTKSIPSDETKDRFEFSSQGALVQIEVNDFYNSYNVIASSEIMQPTVMNFTSECKCYCSQPENYFYGPRKFIAVKPKKLVIADDGLFFYKDDNEEYKYKNINRIIEYDIENPASTTYELKTNLLIQFDSETEDEIEFKFTSGTATVTTETVATFTEE